MRVTVALVSVMMPISVHAHNLPCADLRDVQQQLTGRYAETAVATGLASNGWIVQLWASPHGETWTITTTNRDGRTCIMQVGKDLEAEPIHE